MTDYTKLGAALTLGGAIGATAATLVLQKRALSAKAKAATPAHEQLLKLYIYDHCPFCVRARMIFGLKKIPHELIFLANHDEATPIALVGAKQAPILQLASGKAFPESMDIVRYVDTNHGGSVLLKEASGREDLKQWIAESAGAFRLVYHPRFHRAHFAEFATLEAREYYRIKKEKYLGMTFDEALAKTPEIVAKANEHLAKLAEIVHSNRSVNASGVSYDDIDIFGRLRG
ncbi:hypothetical protein Poli38472_004712 [Pythium oligandrum]|uniref:GST N-terminal domain-containing protein n=1 Tax=Pythium oligandrum TaxID=41045 RepID=A0A8K1CAY3_PYTOL|nr:hypothetical protein Poli38472_004712 [Pythium oligandrum]|eukprot:TMW59643.1 hypothetical protein Poli38472_004712 [Pythium oligandrum]